MRTTLHAPAMSDDHKHRARIFLHRGDLSQARQCLEQAVADDRESRDRTALSDSLGNLGNTCALLNDFATAEQCYREVLALQRMLHNSHTIAHTLVNLGNLLVGAGHSSKARP
ncbi:MAG: tetratricopeptide repeat protein [Nitrospiraceae bacterium]